MTYYYFHGYNSSPDAKKCLAMKDILGDDNVFAPDFNLPSIKDVDNLLNKLIKEIKKEKNACIVGSSLGALYGLYVASKSGADCVLLNPCMFPQLIIPNVTTDVDVDKIVFVQELSLKAYQNYSPEKVRVWVTKDDELIDHKLFTKPFFHRGVVEYQKFLKDKATGHEFKGFKKIFAKFVKKEEK